MDRKTLRNIEINSGESIVEIQEYFHGANGEHTVYKVTIHKCIGKTPFKKRNIFISMEIPFYFLTENLAKEFVENSDKFSVVDGTHVYGYTGFLFIAQALKPKGIKRPMFEYDMVDAFKSNSKEDVCYQLLKEGGVWGGTVYAHVGSRQTAHKHGSKIQYTNIYKTEHNAAKEGTTGNIRTYKLTVIK